MREIPKVSSTEGYSPRFNNLHIVTVVAYDRFVVDKSTEEVSFTLNYPNGLPTSGTKDGADNTDPPTTIKQDPEAELILHKAKEVHVKEEPKAELNLHKAKEVHVKEEPEAELILHKAKEVHIKSDTEAELILHKAKEVHVKSETEAEF